MEVCFYLMKMNDAPEICVDSKGFTKSLKIFFQVFNWGIVNVFLFITIIKEIIYFQVIILFGLCLCVCGGGGIKYFKRVFVFLEISLNYLNTFYKNNHTQTHKQKPCIYKNTLVNVPIIILNAYILHHSYLYTKLFR